MAPNRPAYVTKNPFVTDNDRAMVPAPNVARPARAYVARPARANVAPAPNVPNAATKRKNVSDHPGTIPPFLRGNMVPTRPAYMTNNPFVPVWDGVGESKTGDEGDDDPPPVVPLAPPAPPIPPLNVPVQPVAVDPRSPFHVLLGSAMRLNLSSAVRKLYMYAGDKQMHDKTLQEVVTAMGITDGELQMLTNAPSNVLVPGDRNNTSISANGIPVKHVHRPSNPYIYPARPLLLRTNNGPVRIKVR